MVLDGYLRKIRKLIPDLDDRYLFRGQSNSEWTLKSGAARRLNPGSSKEHEVYVKEYLYYHRQLIERARRIVPFGDAERPLNDLQMMANLQHFGAGTGLLDFTRNPLVALWFASSDFNEDDGKIFILSDSDRKCKIITSSYEDLDSDQILSKQSGSAVFSTRENNDLINEELSKFEYLIWEPPMSGHAGIRIFGQRSVFIIGRPDIQVQDVSSLVVLAEHKRELLAELATVDISENTIFRDLVGYAKLEGPDVPYAPSRNPHHYLKRGNESLRNDRLNDAITSYTRCIEISIELGESMLEPYFYRAHVYSILGLFDQANNDYTEIISNLQKISPAELTNDLSTLFLASHSNRANARTYSREFDAAIEDYKLVESVNMTFNRYIYYNWGNTLFYRMDFYGAAEKYKMQLTLDEYSFDALINLALAHVLLGQWARAEETYEEASTQRPLPPQTLDSLQILISVAGAFTDELLVHKGVLRVNRQELQAIYTHPNCKQSIQVQFTGLAGNAGNLGWRDMPAGLGMSGGKSVTVQLDPA